MPAGQPVETPVGRNEPCPCRSGRRYKQCHGSTSRGSVVVDERSIDAKSLLVRGGEAHRRHDLDAAERDYRSVLAHEPANPVALHYLGMLLYQRGRAGEALPLLERSLVLLPNNAEFHSNRGLALAAVLRDHDAVTAFRRALELAPNHAGAWNNLGLVLQATGDVGGAVNAFRRSLELAQDSPQAHWNLALALLLLGEYGEGFREYEWRLHTPELAPFLRTQGGPRWDGSDPAGKTLLLTSEQGLGDTLQNIRFATVLASRGAQVVVAVQAALAPLVATVSGVATAIAVDDPLPRFDAHVSLMSLPGLLHAGPDAIFAPRRYLTPDPLRLLEAQQAVEDSAPDALRVGLVWSGAANGYNPRRACPLHRLGPLLEIAGVRCFSLQREGEALAAGDAPFAAQLVALPMRNDFAGTAALVDALDLVISVDTSMAHLAGALGKPVWILLPFAPDWRWRLNREDSLWYPTARLFRQRAIGDWTAPLQAVEAALRGLASARLGAGFPNKGS